MTTNLILRARSSTTSTNQLLATHTNKNPCSEHKFPKQTNKEEEQEQEEDNKGSTYSQKKTMYVGRDKKRKDQQNYYYN